MKLTRPQMLRDAERAFRDHEFVVYYQPQYNAATGFMVGAEALVRWKHPEVGLVSPLDFIGCFEESDMISRLDLYVFEEVCRFQKARMDEGMPLIPLSFNLSRADVYRDGFVDSLDKIKAKYGVPDAALRAEITESIAATGLERSVAVVDRLHASGFLVEVDDFGSGYSSLGILKDIRYDMMKLDMSFLSGDDSGRGSTILMSVVHMARWLDMPVIAEGVETKVQLEFLKSIGCEYIQGYLYSKPLPENEFYEKLLDSEHGVIKLPTDLKNSVKPVSFWNDDSLDTMMFNSFVGGAAVFRYAPGGRINVLRVNKHYLEEMGMNFSEQDVIRGDVRDGMDEENSAIYMRALERAIATEEEQECETWRRVSSACCGDDTLCIRTRLVLIGHSGTEYVLYAAIRNVTAEKRRYSEALRYESQFKNVMEQVNIYYWEYNVATKDMFPCYRCMRDLGLPAVVHNYPEPAFEAGIFPWDYADMYRDWHKRIAAGEKTLEAVIPLTAGRVPFRVRYETEFDELGRPIRAHGSATYIVPEAQK